MKIPLQYQRTEYDCGPTTVLNGISFLFRREEIPPELVQHIMLYCLDSYNGKGERGKNGTSYLAMQFVSGWLNQYGQATKFPVQAEYLSGEEVTLAENGKIISALQQGGAVVARVMYGCWHYVLLTGSEGGAVALWDPYYRVHPFTQPGIDIVAASPCRHNRLVQPHHLAQTGKSPYAFGPLESREAVLLFNQNTRKTPERTIEYFI